MSEYVQFLKEVFEGLGPITTRKMFGGHGLYHDAIMFALIADEQLYLKVDAINKHYFDTLDLPQFAYDKGDKLIKMSYCLAPEIIFEDHDLAVIWARRSFEAAKRNYKSKKKNRKTSI